MKYFDNPWARVGFGLVIVIVLGFTLKSQLFTNVQVPTQLAVVGGDGTPWTKVSIGPNGSVGNTSAIAVGLDGFARIVYYNSTSNDLKFVRCADINCSTKTTTVLDPKGTRYARPSIVIASDGLARISYYDNNTYDIKTITKEFEIADREDWDEY